jgi:Protein of unknown function (DUF3568)
MRRLALLGVALMAPLCGGCLWIAAGAAVGAGGYAAYTMTSRLYRDYPVDVPRTATAVRETLAEMGYPPAKEEPSDDRLLLETRAPDKTRISIELRPMSGKVPADGTTTRVGIHIGITGDEELTTRIQDAIGKRLGIAPPTPPQPTPQDNGSRLRPVAAETSAPPLAK